MRGGFRTGHGSHFRRPRYGVGDGSGHVCRLYLHCRGCVGVCEDGGQALHGRGSHLNFHGACSQDDGGLLHPWERLRVPVLFGPWAHRTTTTEGEEPLSACDEVDDEEDFQCRTGVFRLGSSPSGDDVPGDQWSDRDAASAATT